MCRRDDRRWCDSTDSNLRTSTCSYYGLDCFVAVPWLVSSQLHGVSLINNSRGK